MRKLLRFFALFFVPLILSSIAFGTTTVTGTMQNLGTGAATPNAFMRFWLRGCAGNQPRVSGTALIAPTQGGVYFFDFPANASGQVSGTLYSTRDVTGNNGGDIQCGTSTTSVWYGMQAFYGGKSGPEIPVHAKNTTTLDITQVVAITTNPVVTSPTGDTTYARLDGGNQPFTGNVTPSGNGTLSLGSTSNRWNASLQATTTKSLSAIQFADIFSGADNSAKIQAAIAACSNSCVVDARNLASEGSGGSTTIDPGTSKTITLLLPAGTTFVNQIILRPSFHIIGMGAGGFSQQSILQSCATCGTTDVFVLGGTTASSAVRLQGFRLYGAGGSGGSTNQSAIALIAQVNGGGLWLSEIDDVNILGFCGAGGTHGIIRLDGSAGGSPPGINQFDTLRHVEAYRPSGCGPVLEIKGFTGQFAVRDSHLDSSSGVTTGTDISISDVSSSLFPFNIIFDNVTTQGGDTGFSVAGCNACTLNQTHMEAMPHAMIVNTSAGAITQIQWTNSQFNGNVGTGGGGYLVNMAAPSTNASLLFTGNNFGSPTSVFTGNTAGITSFANTGGTLVSGSFLWNALSAFPSLTVNTGVQQNGSGFKHIRVAGCTTGATSGNSCLTTITWTTAFADANYTVSCTLVGTANLGHLDNTGTIAAASFTINTVTDTNNAISGTVDCIGVHDTTAGP